VLRRHHPSGFRTNPPDPYLLEDRETGLAGILFT